MYRASVHRVLVACLLVGTQACAAAHPSSRDSLAGGISPPIALPAPTPFTLPPPPASLSDPAFDLRLRTGLARFRIPDSPLVDVEDNAFLLVAFPGSKTFDPSVALVRQALPALTNHRFPRRPTSPVTVYVLDDEHRYKDFCNARYHEDCESRLGIYLSTTREIVVDQHSGTASILHELTHVLLEDDFPTSPQWLREGISSLYERPVISGLEIHGATNNRRETLLNAMHVPSQRELTHLDGVFSMPAYLFDEKNPDAPVAYAAVRFACQWLDSPGIDHLWAFYQTWRDHAKDDPTGEKSFAQVVGQTPSEADAAWQKWVRSL